MIPSSSLPEAPASGGSRASYVVQPGSSCAGGVPGKGSLTGRCGLGRLIRGAPEAIAPPHPPSSLNRLTGRCGLPEQVEGEHVDAMPAGQPIVNNTAEVGFVPCKAKSYRIL
jgi:hypothetical protein